MSGILLICTTDQSDQHYDCGGESCIVKWFPWICASLGSAVFSACNVVLSEWLLSSDSGGNKLLAVCEVAFFNSILPFCVLIAFAICTQWWHGPPGTAEECTSAVDNSQAQSCSLVSSGNGYSGSCVADGETAGSGGCTYNPIPSWEFLAVDIPRRALTIPFIFICAGLCCAKMVDRLTKFYVVSLKRIIGVPELLRPRPVSD